MNFRLIRFLFALFLSSQFLLGQTNQSNSWLNDSSRAIQFGIGNYFDVEAFNSKSISFKKHLSAETAIRVGIVLSASSYKEEANSRDYINDTLISSKSISYSPTYSISAEVSTLYLWYLSTQSDFYLFLGLGPELRFDRREYSTSDYYDQNRTWSIGMEGSIGAEWFVTHRFSLHAEYLANALYVGSKENGWNTDVNGNRLVVEDFDNTSTAWRFQSGTVAFGLSIYF